MAKSKRTVPTLNFSQKLILNQYLIIQFGADDFKDLSSDLKRLELEQIDSDGVTGFLPRISQRQGISISKDKLSEYDRNIVRHLNKVNENRDVKISLKYFQYLSLLFVEFYLDMYFNDRESLLNGLNEVVEQFNQENPSDAILTYTESDLNKIALWNATGSGKTILMHINYYQYLHYASKYMNDDTTIILLTPNEGLSSQHILEFETDGIKAEVYDKNASRGMFTDNYIVQVLENSKLAEKDGDKTVAVSRFGCKNLLFVDEGHKGSSGDKWMPFRNELCKDGFSFEYSATFGQAVKASGNDDLIQQYAKCILFDYSYYYFYNDGYGKDYNIINMADIQNEQNRQKYLTACLLSYYQQKKLYLEKAGTLGRFNVENPLFVFVGHTVTASNNNEDKQTLSDVADILLFFKSFSDKKEEYTGYIEQVLSGNSGLLDDKQRDVFARRFVYLGSLGLTAQNIYEDMLRIIMNSKVSGAEMHISNIKGVEGEIAIRMGDNEPFGVINVGNTSELIKILKSNGFEATTLDIGYSLFQGITNIDSTINLLIGSKKFTEGWNCWRVSTMGLMNVGRSEGSEIIQLFGRGVRLMGYKRSLKRSKIYKKFDDNSIDIPKHTELLETLNVFGIRADYMQTFKEFLESENIPSGDDDMIQIELPVIKNKESLKRKLKTLRLPDSLNYKKDAPKPILKLVPGIEVIQDCYTQLQQKASVETGDFESPKDICYLTNTDIALFDYNQIWLELENYKNEKNRYNVHIIKDELKKLLQDNTWYKIYIPKQEKEVHSFSDIERMQNIAISLLKKYFDKFYIMLKGEWETPLMEYVDVDESDPNFIENDTYLVTIQDPENNDDIKTFVETLVKNVADAKSSGKLESLTNTSNAFLKSFSFVNSLYNPYLYISGKTTEIAVSPVALVKSEYDFVEDLKSYVTKNPDLVKDSEIFIIRNKSKKGVGFFVESGFYPDFIMWLIKNGKQYITFIDPHGMGREYIDGAKVQMFHQIKALEAKLADKNVILNSFILSPTAIQNLVEKHSKPMWNENHVLFMQDEYVKEMIEGILE
jgi:hypothetical protein